jgi:hypothetical protein
MADPAALYSYQGAEPQLLPHEIHYTEGWGAVNYRQGIESFTEEELAKAGYTGPYTKPSFDENTQYIDWNTEKLKWDVKEIVKEPDFVDPNEFMYRVRGKRNLLLQQTDWTQLPDNGLTEEQKEKYIEYRQKLRDYPETIQLDIERYMFDSSLVEWPTFDADF